MSTFQQFFPGSGGSGGSGGPRMDLEVLILSGGGGAAASAPPRIGPCAHSGVGGGGAVFVGSVPVSPGCTVPVVVGGGGAGVASQPCGTNTSGARGGCSSITTPEGTLCVAGGGAGGHAGLCGIGYKGLLPTCDPPANHVYHGGTGGTGGQNFRPGSNNIYSLTGVSEVADSCITEGGKPFYSTGQYNTDNIYCQLCPTNPLVLCQKLTSNNFCGPGQMNHKYGTFMGGAATGGLRLEYGCPTCLDCSYNSRASGGAGGHAITTRGMVIGSSCIVRAGKGYCSDITGTLEEYGRGVVNIPVSCCACFPAWGSGDANSGRGGSVLMCASGCICSGSGGSGVIVIRYPDQFPAAPASPGATDCSPATPGYYTYRFNSTGSITLP
jgi:hypothetical protein